MFKRRIFRQGRCEWCAMETRQQRRIPEHLVHGTLTVLTCGLWGVSWLSVSMVMRGEPWRCRRCRAPQSADPAKGPVELSAAEAVPGMGWVILPGR